MHVWATAMLLTVSYCRVHRTHLNSALLLHLLVHFTRTKHVQNEGFVFRDFFLHSTSCTAQRPGELYQVNLVCHL